MTLEGAITFFLAIFIFGITPGPGVFAILARSLVHGAKSCSGLAVGMIMSDIAYLIMACFGLATIASAWEELFFVIRIVGAGYLLYLGWQMWQIRPVSADVPTGPTNTPKGWLASFTQGFLISASNPKVILFYVAFLPTFMDLTVLDAQDIVLATVLTFFALLLGLMLIAYSAAQARRFLTTPSSMQRLNRTAGSIMMGAGVYIGIRG